MSSATPARNKDPVRALDQATRAIAAASAECLQAVAAYDERKLWRLDGATSMASWLAARYGLALGTAREWVRVGHALRGRPEIAETYALGEISWDRLRLLTGLRPRKPNNLIGPAIRRADPFRPRVRPE